MDAVRLIAFSDYLCPWCYNGSIRLQRLEQEFEGRVRVEFRAFLLRPAPPARGRDLERFRAYTRSWERPAAEPDAGSFQTWQGAAGPPSHSLPPQQLAKAAARLGPEAFRRMHERLLRAYFAESRDISDPDTLRALWSEAGLAPEAFAEHEDPEIRRQVLAEHEDALALGVTGVPAVMAEPQRIPIVGALPMETYRRWVERLLAAPSPGPETQEGSS
jgi:predicted DsbA family dithiol-disulfide isomerase